MIKIAELTPEEIQAEIDSLTTKERLLSVASPLSFPALTRLSHYLHDVPADVAGGKAAIGLTDLMQEVLHSGILPKTTGIPESALEFKKYAPSGGLPEALKWIVPLEGSTAHDTPRMMIQNIMHGDNWKGTVDDLAAALGTEQAIRRVKGNPLGSGAKGLISDFRNIASDYLNPNSGYNASDALKWIKEDAPNLVDDGLEMAKKLNLDDAATDMLHKYLGSGYPENRIKDMFGSIGRTSIGYSAGSPDILAHEAGHAVGLAPHSKLMAWLSDKTGLRVHDAVGVAEAAATYPAGEFLRTYGPEKLRRILDVAANSKKLPVKLLYKGLTSMPMTGMATSALSASDTIKDVLRMDPTGIGEGIADIAEEYPTATAMSGFAPILADELYASLAAGKLTTDFYNTMKKLPAGILSEVAKGGVNLSTGMKRPILEGLKTVLKNVPNYLSYAAPIAIMGAASYYGSKKEDLQSRLDNEQEN